MKRTASIIVAGATILAAASARAQDSGAVHGCVTSWHSVADNGYAVKWLSAPPAEAQEWDNTSDVSNWWAYAKPDVKPGSLPYRNVDECGQFFYTEIRNATAAKVVLKGSWNPFIDNQKHVSGVPSQRVDSHWPTNCGHTHLRTFVWYSTDDGEHYTYLGSQGQTTWQNSSPVQDSPAYCPLESDVDPSFRGSSIDTSVFFWGPHEMDVSSTGMQTNTYMIATQIITHLTTDCGQFICYHPVANIFVSRPPYFTTPNMTVP